MDNESLNTTLLLLSSALVRPGRFDMHVTVPRPDVKGRTEILNWYLSKIKVDPGRSQCDYAKIVKRISSLISHKTNLSEFQKQPLIGNLCNISKHILHALQKR